MQEAGRAAVGNQPVRTRTRRSGTILIASAAAVIALDQATKALAASKLASGRPVPIVGGVLSLQLLRNPGGAFGILQSQPLLFFAATGLIVAAVLVWGLRSGQAPVALGLVAGGGLGNLIDRVVRAPGHLHGRVVDFIHLRYWPTFNLADTSIVVGVGLLILFELRPRRFGGES